MSRCTYVSAALMGTVGALLVSATASAAVIGLSYTTIVTPKTQSGKTFGPAKIENDVRPIISEMSVRPTTLTIQFSPNLRWTPGRLPQCDLSSISTLPDSTARSLCGKSNVGVGGAYISGGEASADITAYNGVPMNGNPTIGFHADVLNFLTRAYEYSETAVGVLNTRTNTLTISLPSDWVGDVDVTLDLAPKRPGIKTGHKHGKPTYYLSARCRKHWIDNATETFQDGSSFSASSVYPCHRATKF